MGIIAGESYTPMTSSGLFDPDRAVSGGCCRGSLGGMINCTGWSGAALVRQAVCVCTVQLQFAHVAERCASIRVVIVVL